VNAACHFGHACQKFGNSALHISIAWAWTTLTLLLPNSTKLYRASSRVRCLKAGKPMIAEPFSFPSSENWIAWISNRVVGSIQFVPRQWVFVGGVKYWLCLAVFRDLLTRWIHDTRPGLIQSHCPSNLLLFNLITSASSTRQSTYPDILYKNEEPVNRCDVLSCCCVLPLPTSQADTDLSISCVPCTYIQ